MFDQIETAALPMTDPFVPQSPSTRSPQSNERPGRQTLQSWQARAIAKYAGSAQAYLRERLTRRILALTGCAPRAEAIIVDSAGHCAMTTVGGVTFRLCGRELMMVRPCAHCETGHFESPAIMTMIDLGYVLAAWRPYHSECEPTDPNDDVSW